MSPEKAESERKESFEVEESAVGMRLDAALTRFLPDVSRARSKRWIEEGRVRVGGRPVKASRTLARGDRVEVSIPEPVPATPLPEAIALDILYEDRDIVVVNKRAGMVVHPAPGHSTGTLVNALLAHSSDLSGIGGVLRPGIVHRLDAGTSGVLVVAKNDRAHQSLQSQFQKRSVSKIYLALAHGTPGERFAIDRPIGRDARDRKKISSRTRTPRQATTEISRLETLPGCALLEIRIRTGRTHQIRVHLSEAGHPVVGDRDYGSPNRAPLLLRDFPRPALHAQRLSFQHPSSGEDVSYEAPLPEDFSRLLEELRAQRKARPRGK
ncbi:MAG TPA: RluA family pseudouridine synthase [Vicinamibacteria bacterium]|nr:RluA family pseudouridine synthase [Vicinamibacteria bacterium]